MSLVHHAVKAHYEQHIYPYYPLLASVRLCDTYALNLDALWSQYTGHILGKRRRILLAGSGTFAPYPTALANPNARIIALDLSRNSLQRARWHTWLHGLFNVCFIAGEIVHFSRETSDRFHFIDCYGVLHHIHDALEALKALHHLLAEGAVLRLMVYSRCARRKDEAIRAAFRLLDIRTVEHIRSLHRKAKAGSRFRHYLDNTPEARTATGLADMFLHPFATTYTVDSLLALLAAADLEPLQWTHEGALQDVQAEAERLRSLEQQRTLSHNFVVIVGRRADRPLREAWAQQRAAGDVVWVLNPVIHRAWPRWPWQTLHPAPKLGHDNPRIDRPARQLLAPFVQPVEATTLPTETRAALKPFVDAWYVLEQAGPQL